MSAPILVSPCHGGKHGETTCISQSPPANRQQGLMPARCPAPRDKNNRESVDSRPAGLGCPPEPKTITIATWKKKNPLELRVESIWYTFSPSSRKSSLTRLRNEAFAEDSPWRTDIPPLRLAYETRYSWKQAFTVSIGKQAACALTKVFKKPNRYLTIPVLIPAIPFCSPVKMPCAAISRKKGPVPRCLDRAR